MSQKTDSFVANMRWQLAEKIQRTIHEEVKKELAILESLSNAQSRRFRTAYLALAPIEFLILAVFLLPLLEASLQELYDSDHWMMTFIAYLSLIPVMIFLHCLVSQSAIFLSMARTGENWADDYGHLKNRLGPVFNLVFPPEDPSRIYKGVFVGLTFLVFTGLSYTRAFVLNGDGYEHISPQNWGSFLLMQGITMLLLLIMLFFVSSFNIEWRRWMLNQELHQLTSKRDRELKQFRKHAHAVEKKSETSGGYFQHIDMNEEDRICLERLKMLRRDRGERDCLIPIQSLDLEVYFEKTPVEGLQIRALTMNQIPITKLTDAEGKARLEWRSYSRNMEFLAVGGKNMYNVNFPETVPQIIELTTGSGRDYPSLDAAA